MLDLFSSTEHGLDGVRELGRAVAELASAAQLAARVEALERLATWVHASDSTLPWPAGEADPAGGDARYRRLGVLIVILERVELAHDAVRTAIEDALRNGDALVLFAEAGVPEHRGIVQEALERVQNLVLPAPRDEHDLGRLVARVLPDARSARWLELAPRALILRLVAALKLAPDAFDTVRAAMDDALRLLAARVEATGLARSMRLRQESTRVQDTAWYRLPRRTEHLIESLDRGAIAGEAVDDWYVTLAAVRERKTEVIEHLEHAGISVDLVFALDTCSRMLDRMELIAGMRILQNGDARTLGAVRALAVLAHERASSDSLRQLASDSSRQLARRVVERAGVSGEHYIAATRAEYGRMWLRAAWGGLLTTGTAAMKLVIGGAKLAPLPEGLLQGFNFAGSFVFMQATHGTLATKQPSMTAATLAGILQETSSPQRSEEMATLVARILRSQLAAAFGNVIVVAIGATLLDQVWRQVKGTPFISPEKAEQVLESMHMTHSATWWYAALTGVILWFSSVVAGSIENWTAYRRIPRAIAEHPLGERIGRDRMRLVSRWFARDVSAYSGSIVLGMLLGLVPAIGLFTGLPLDVRHVTLSTGQVVLASASLGAWSEFRLVWPLGGVALMFFLNLGVSFTLALWVACRARGVGLAGGRAILLAVLRRFVNRPAEFFWPPRVEHGPTPTPGH